MVRLVAGLLAAVALGAFAAPPPLRLTPYASGLNQPVEVVAARDGSNRLFVLEKPGTIRIVRDGVVEPEPFLDITGRVSEAGERGLLGLAFDPAFASNRRFFVFYTRLPDDASGGALRVSSFQVDSANPDRALAASEREVITIPHPGASNHNGGRIAFGPDGYLYVGTGDGGGGGDPGNNGQNMASLLGKLLRLDVSPESGYLIPAGNPYVGIAGRAPEIWAIGLRNPWKFAFDRAGGDLYVADVGQGAREEVNFVPAGTAGGVNFGWRIFEGTACFNPSSGCSLAGHWPPVLEYGHNSQGGDSITGGYVYRGSRIPGLQGHYLYGDFGSNRVWAGIREGGSWKAYVVFEPPNALDGITSFGEDDAGELYVASIRSGTLHRIEGMGEGRNVALASNGSFAFASSTYSAGFPASAVIDGDRAGRNFGDGSGWNDGTPGAYPDWIQVVFPGLQTIERVVLYTLQDDPRSPVEPTDGMTFSSYGIVDVSVEGWTGSRWVLLGRATGNDRVKRSISFAPVAVDRIYVHITRALGGYSHLTEVEAWTPPLGGTNVAAASAGGVAFASSTYGPGFPASAAIDGERAGANFGAASGWNDGTQKAWPDWLQVLFAGPRTIDRVVVYTLQDDPSAPSEPTDSMTFTRFGVQDFTVEGWTGSQWVLLGRVTDNDRVKRTLTFSPVSVDRIFVHVTRSLGGFSHITEVEAFAP